MVLRVDKIKDVNAADDLGQRIYREYEIIGVIMNTWIVVTLVILSLSIVVLILAFMIFALIYLASDKENRSELIKSFNHLIQKIPFIKIPDISAFFKKPPDI